MSGKLEYHSNNSGGDWWLDDNDWQALEAGGWHVEWVKDQDDRVFRDGDRFLGALATDASKRFDSKREGIEEWERLTGESAASLGCGCCGPPHTFTWIGDDGEYDYIYPDAPLYGELDY